MSDGVPWLLLRGLTRQAGHWGDFPQRLRQASACPVLVLDLPGFGARRSVGSPASISGIAEDCRRALQQRGLVPPWRLLALSLGGMVAIDWMQRRPDDFACATLVNTSAAPFAPVFRRLRPTALPFLLAALCSGDALRRERIVLRLTSRIAAADGAAAAQLLADWCALQQLHPPRRADALRQILAAMRFRALATAPAVPLRLLASRRDALVDVRCSRALAAAWHVPLLEHPEAGHDLPLDAPDWLLQQLLDAPVPPAGPFALPTM